MVDRGHLRVYLGYAAGVGKTLLVGNRKLMRDNNITLNGYDERATALQGSGHTVVYAALNGKFAGMIAIADAVRANAKLAVEKLTSMGVEVAMVTGDNRATAERIASELGINIVFAEVLPGQKADKVKELQAQGKLVAMVGDGINDAPALAQADVGIAIGSGSDIAKETGGIILIKDDIMDVPRAIMLSRATMKKIKQNLFWALVYNAAGIPVAALGLLSPIIAAAAMALSSISVIANSSILRRLKVADLK